jgi:hypothetical protein
MVLNGILLFFQRFVVYVINFTQSLFDLIFGTFGRSEAGV